MTTYQPDAAAPAGDSNSGLSGTTPTLRPKAALSGRSWGQRVSPTNIAAVYVLVVEFVIFTIAKPSLFPTWATVKQVLDGNAITALAALAIIIPLSAATFDLSFAYVMSLSGVTTAHLVVSHGMNVELAGLLGIGSALIIGFINGFVVVVMRIDSFIGTLGTGSLVQAFITLVTKDNPIDSQKLAGSFSSLSQGLYGGFQHVVYWAVAVAILLWLFMEYTATGRRLYAAGFNPEAARLAGIRVNRLRFGSLLASSFFAGLAGVLLASYIGSGSPTAGTQYLLPAFAAAFVGASQLKRGRFNSWGTILAVLMLGTGTVGLSLAWPNAWDQQMFTGIVLLAALAFTGFQNQNLLRGKPGAVLARFKRKAAV
jgi:ribose transport system permease protein